jgi:hypothetical protein
MLGEKKTLPLWSQRRPNFLKQERALAARRTRDERHTDAEHAVIERKLAQHRFEVSKGKVHPAA